MNLRSALLVILGTVVMGGPVRAELTVSPLFSDQMVIQRETDAPVWGTATPGETISVRASWGELAKTVADDEGQWTVRLATPKAGGPFEIIIVGSTTIQISDVLAGDVWLCSGQSNMAGNVANLVEAQGDDYPQIRHLTTALRGKNPDASKPGIFQWVVTTPETVSGFTATGYFFGRRLHEELDVPIGLLKAAAGGTLIEPWTPEGTYEGAEGSLYKKHIRPLIPFAIKGAIWYQGEANARTEPQATPYSAHLQGLIGAWRAAWGQGDFPFYFVQLPSIGSDNRFYFIVREQMRQTLGTLPNLGMTVNIDIDEGLHPRSKHIMGRRLALLALRDVYGKQLVATGPLLQSVRIEGNQAICTFTEVGSRLRRQGERLTHFEVAGKDGQFVAAQARIEGNTVVVASDEISKPVAVRYAYENNPHEVTLFNRDGLPASPFAWSK